MGTVKVKIYNKGLELPRSPPTREKLLPYHRNYHRVWRLISRSCGRLLSQFVPANYKMGRHTVLIHQNFYGICTGPRNGNTRPCVWL